MHGKITYYNINMLTKTHISQFVKYLYIAMALVSQEGYYYFSMYM